MTQLLTEKWNDVLESEKVEKINDPIRKRATAQLLENQETFLREDAAATSSIPGAGAVGSNWDPIMIAMVRRMAPKLIAYDVCGVQPMTGPTGLIFAMKARYTNKDGAEAQGLNEVNPSFSGNGTAADATNPFQAAFDDGSGSMATSAAEADTSWDAMSMTIERTSVTAGSRQLRADWSLELTQDLKAIHGLEAENELSNILSTEITNEINREVVRKIYTIAKVGAQYNARSWVTATATDPTSANYDGDGDIKGFFDLNAAADGDGRWSVEKFKGLFFAIEREANAVAFETRRGKGNIMITSANVASALVLAGILNYSPATQAAVNLEVDVTGVTFAGTVGRHKVYIDPYLSTDGFVVGYKGTTQYDAGFFYCPYVPLQLVRAVNPANFQPALGFKTRYGIVANPFTANTKNGNVYYRKVAVVGV